MVPGQRSKANKLLRKKDKETENLKSQKQKSDTVK